MKSYMEYRHSLVVSAAFVIACLAVFPIGAADHIGEAVFEEVRTRGTAFVVVALESPSPPINDLGVLRDEVSRSQDAVLDRLNRHDLQVTHRFRHVPALAGWINASGLDTLSTLAEVRRIDLDVGGAGTLAEAVPLTNSDDVHALGFTGAGVVTVVLDSGADSDHADLMDDLSDEACFCFDGGAGCCPNGATTQVGIGSAEDDNGHGTNVSGIITGGGVVAPTGVAPDAEVVSVKVLDASGGFSTSSDIVAALDWVLFNRPDAKLVNMSLGTFARFAGDCDNATSWTMSLAAAINALRANGTMCFVSAGNAADGVAMEAPACIANAISVGAVYDADVGPGDYGVCSDPSTMADQVVCFSNSNSTTDIFAPGAAITAAGLGGATSTYFGTSQASPHSAGCAALLLEAAPMASPNQIEAALEGSDVLVIDAKNGLSFPRVNCLDAYDELSAEIFSDGFESGDLTRWSVSP